MTQRTKKKASAEIGNRGSNKEPEKTVKKPVPVETLGKKQGVSEKNNIGKSSGNIVPASKKNSGNNDNLPEKIDDQIDPAALARGDEPMTIVDHLTELRSRLLIVLGSFFVFTCIAFYFSDQLIYIINRPFIETGNRLNVFTMTGGFIVKMKVSAASALLLLLPLFIFHIWRFISPAIDRPERLFSRFTIISAIALFYSGVLFVFFVLSSAIRVMLGFIPPTMLSTIDANDYLHFIFFMSFIMGLLCELPIVMLVLTKIGLISPQFLIRKRKYAVIIIWITAAIVTPGADILSQSLVGIPLMLLYEVSIIVSRIVLIRKKRKELKHRNS